MRLTALATVVFVLSACSSSSSVTGTESSSHSSGSGAGSSSHSETSTASSESGQSMSAASGKVPSFTIASQIAAIAANVSSSCTGSADGGETCTSSSEGQGVAILLTNRSQATCSSLLSEDAMGKVLNFANLQALELGVVNQAGNVATGTYSIITSGDPSTGASAMYTTTTADCGDGVAISAVSGSVTLTTVSSSMIAGSYDVSFGAGNSLSGSFSTATCALPDGGGPQNSPDGGNVTCQ